MYVQINDEVQDSLDIREAVFQVEQGIPRELDFDEEDDNALHFVAYNDEDQAIGTVRVRFFDAGRTSKLERLAVLKMARGEGVATALMEAVDDYLTNRNVDYAYMNAQLHVKPFHEKMGYVSVGETFDEAGIEHIKMEKHYN